MTIHINQASVTISTSNVSASGTIPGGQGRRFVRCTNKGTSIAYVRTGIATPTAVATDNFIGAGETVIFEKPIADHLIGVILDTGTGSLIVAACDNQ